MEVNVEVFESIVVRSHDMVSELLHNRQVGIAKLKVGERAEAVCLAQHPKRFNTVVAMAVSKPLEEFGCRNVAVAVAFPLVCMFEWRV